MKDVFYEQLVKRQPTGKDRLIRVAAILGVVLVFVLGTLFLQVIGWALTVAAGFGVYILFGRLKKEYEYSFTNGELDIDVIYNKSSRKRVFSGHVRDFEMMAHAADLRHENTFNTADERQDYSTGVISDRSYTFLTRNNNKRRAITIEPNDSMFEVIVSRIPHSKFYPK